MQKKMPVVNEIPVFACDLCGGEFLDGVSKSLRSKIRRSIRRYEARGEVRLVKAETPDQITHAWKNLSALHEAAWNARGRSGAFSNPAFIAFHERLRNDAPGAVELLCLHVGDDIVGVLYNLRHGDEVLNYQSGFRYEDDNQLTPGFVAHALAAQRYMDTGVTRYNLLAGDADYKRRLGKEIEVFKSFIIERPTLRNKALAIARAVKSRLRP